MINSVKFSDLDIIYEDDHLLVVHKPAGLLSQGDHTGDADLVNLYKRHLTLNKQTTSPYAGLIHRLDRPVSGLILIAKNRSAAGKLSEMQRDQKIDKVYWCIVKGKARPNDYLEHYLVKDTHVNVVTAYSQPVSGSQKALLTYQCLAYRKTENYSLLAVHLITGRTHQIRVQLAKAALPVLNDHKYGHPAAPGNRLALHASGLRFEHPYTKKPVVLSALPAPEKPWDLFDLSLHQKNIFL